MNRKLAIILILSIVVALFLVQKYYWKATTYPGNMHPLLYADRTVTFPSEVPPDPGHVGKATPEGIDSDQDGIRDDLQRWVYAVAGSDSAVKKTLTALAINYQKNVTTVQNDDEWIQNSYEFQRAITCLERQIGWKKTIDYTQILQARARNTLERSKIALKNDRSVEGHTVLENFDGKEVCD